MLVEQVMKSVYVLVLVYVTYVVEDLADLHSDPHLQDESSRSHDMNETLASYMHKSLEYLAAWYLNHADQQHPHQLGNQVIEFASMKAS